MKKTCNILAALALTLLAVTAHAERVKDLASVAGVRGNQLIGYGLVVGLDGTGDQTSQAPFTIQSIRNMLAKFGVTIPANVNPQLKNVAAVTVRADLPAFSKPGQTIDIEPDNSISSLKVADAMIAYGGKGPLANASSPGILSRFFNLPFLPF